jgi:rod shape-determining protein MreC
VLSASGHAWFLKDAINVISTPFRSVFNYCADGIKGFADYFTEFDRISKENEELRKKNEELNNLQSKIEVLKEENAWLRDFLDVDNHNMTFDFTDAAVIGRNAGSSHNTLTLSKGSLHGIEVGMVVITGEGLVGRITEVGLTSCEVLCVIDISSSVGAMVERSAMIGIVEGYYDSNCRFLYTTGFNDISDIAVGDTIISSGKGSIYPYGIKIGTVSEITIDDASRSAIATIVPSVDFDSISRVMIIKSFKVE